MLKRKSLTLAFCLYLLTINSVFATEPEKQTKKEEESVITPVVYNHDVFSQGLGKGNARMQLMQSELARRVDKHRHAAEFSRKAVQSDPNDMDARVAHGEALYNMIQSGNTDPVVHNECVKTWLIVHRNLVGEDSGLTLKGIGIPFVQKMFEDTRSTVAKDRLIKLVGRVPAGWETNNRFLSKVLLAEPQVSARIVPKKE
jgi:hypothetical protein